MITQAQIAENRRRAIETAHKKAVANQRKLSDAELTIMSYTKVVPSPSACYVAQPEHEFDGERDDAIIADRHAGMTYLQLKQKYHVGSKTIRRIIESATSHGVQTSRRRRPLLGGIDPKIIADEISAGMSICALRRKYKARYDIIKRLINLAEKGLPNDGRSEQSL